MTKLVCSLFFLALLDLFVISCPNPISATLPLSVVHSTFSSLFVSRHLPTVLPSVTPTATAVPVTTYPIPTTPPLAGWNNMKAFCFPGAHCHLRLASWTSLISLYQVFASCSRTVISDRLRCDKLTWTLMTLAIRLFTCSAKYAQSWAVALRLSCICSGRIRSWAGPDIELINLHAMP